MKVSTVLMAVKYQNLNLPKKIPGALAVLIDRTLITNVSNASSHAGLKAGVEDYLNRALINKSGIEISIEKIDELFSEEEITALFDDAIRMSQRDERNPPKDWVFIPTLTEVDFDDLDNN